ncbi:hypothetical protein CRM22_000820 [Opisthorchis felineus]|uniref:Uncharacterized protein n=1 Tax=Opisthorchis felineus TaxID=147828 RepID=A0A4S2MDJ7_OPIFE|nr:hypothetical protein CRM22_000820 [Opisthorchis felineus]
MCSKETVHCFTVVINSFLWIAGIALVTVGLVNFSQQSGLPLPQEVMFKTVSLGVLVDGLLLLVLEAVAFFAQLPVGKRNLKIFAALLTFLVICETFFVFFVVAVTASSRQDIFETVSSYVILYYADSASQASMDQLQNQVRILYPYVIKTLSLFPVVAQMLWRLYAFGLHSKGPRNLLGSKPSYIYTRLH